MIARFFRIIAQLFVLCKCFLSADRQYYAQRRSYIAENGKSSPTPAARIGFVTAFRTHLRSAAALFKTAPAAFTIALLSAGILSAFASLLRINSTIMPETKISAAKAKA